MKGKAEKWLEVLKSTRQDFTKLKMMKSESRDIGES